MVPLIIRLCFRFCLRLFFLTREQTVCVCTIGMWSIRTLDDSALVKSDLIFFVPSQFGP